MGRYIGETDIIARLGLDKAQRLFRDDDQEDWPVPSTEKDATPEDLMLDDAIVTPLVNQASSEVDGYFRRRYQVPLVTVPEKATAVCLDLVIYERYKVREALTDRWEKIHDDAIKWLKDCSSGVVDLGSNPPPPEATTDARLPQFFTQERKMTAESLKGIL